MANLLCVLLLLASPAARTRAPASAARAQRVILYGTSWCPYCAKTRAFLRERKIEFEDLDIEKDAVAERAMRRKLRAAGLEHRGVPVLDIHGELIEGFSEQAIEEALRQ